MSDATSGPLRDAYEAIQANQLPKARGILSTYIADKPEDPDAWWLYSYAAENPEEARKSLENVLRLDPTYPGARDLLTQVNQALPAGTSVMPITGVRKLNNDVASVPQASQPTVADELDDLDDDFDDEDEDEESGFTTRRVLLALAGFALVVALVFLVFFLQSGRVVAPASTQVAGNTAQPTLDVTPDVSAQAPTADATTNVVDVTPTADSGGAATEDGSATTEPVETSTPDGATSPVTTDLGAFYSALSGFTVTPDSVMVESTSLGQTLSATVCLQNQGELRNAIPSGISAIAGVSAQAPAEAQYIGIKFVNCADNNLLRYVVVPIADAQAFAAGTLTTAQLRSAQLNITR